MSLQPNFEIVVAHYNEDLSWLKDEVDACSIYSKGGDKNVPQYPHHKLPNIGREGHTYLYHIIKRYDTLADVTIFLQGRIDDHINISLGEIIERSLKTKDGEVTTFPFRELERFDNWDGIPWEEYPCWKKWSSMPCQYPRSFYQTLQGEFFLGKMTHVNPETGHFMERFWLAIWNPSEYVCWQDGDAAKEKRNRHGQLARGRWHVVPKFVEIDERTLPPTVTQLTTPPLSDED